MLERRWERWGLLVFATVAGDTAYDVQLRKPLGKLHRLDTTRYDHLTKGQPDYFKRATSDLDDFLGQRIKADSPHGEASFLKAAKFLPPIAVRQRSLLFTAFRCFHCLSLGFYRLFLC